MPEEAPKDTERILDSLTSLDTARMTVRWALERIRFLEQANNEMLELLRGAREAKDKLARELEDSRVAADKRLSSIAQKERFVAEMQGMLNSLFKGQIDLKDVLEAKAQLEEHKAQVQAEAQTRVHEAEAKARKQEEDFQRRLVELEANYARALGDAERRYQEQLQDFQRQRHEESLEAGAREARFKEKLLEEVQKQADQYHQKLSLLQLDYSAKREALQKEFEELKEKVFSEARHIEQRQADSFRLSKEHWEAERKRLTDLVAQRDADLAAGHEELKATGDRLKLEAAESVARREDELRALEARLRQELAEDQARREAELRSFEERVRLDAEEAREREERRVEDVTRRMEEERKRHQGEMASLQASFDARLALGVQEQLRVREEELSKRLDSNERYETDFQDRLLRTTQQLQDRMAQIEARAAAEVEAARAEGRRIVEELETRHLKELETARQQGRGLELQLEEALKHERERALKTVEEQVKKDRETFEAIELELRRELTAAQDEVQRIGQAHAQELALALEARQKLREAFERQLASEFAAHEERTKALEQHLAAREAQWRADHENRAAALDHEAAERASRAEAAFQERLKGLEEENRRMSALRQQEANDSALRLKQIQDRFDEKLAAEVKARADLMQKQWEAEKAGLEQRFAGERADFERRLLAERQAWEQKAAEGLAAADVRWREQYAAAQAKVESLAKQSEELTTRADQAERKAAERRPLPWRKAAIGVAASAALAAAGLGGWHATRQGTDLSVPFSHPSGLAWDGDTLWASDWFDQAVYQLSVSKAGTQVVKKHALPGVAPVGLAIGAGHLFLIDGSSAQIQRRKLDRELTLVATIASPGSHPTALHFDGRNLWSADRKTGLLYKHADDETLSVLESFPLGADAAALQFEGADVWWVGSSNRVFSRHGLPPGLSQLEAFSLPELERGSKPVSAFVWKGSELWIGLEGERRLLVRKRGNLKKR